MNCDDCSPMMEKSLDGELDVEQAQCLASHLAACRDCAREYQLLQRERELYDQYSNSRRIEVSPQLWSAVRARLEIESLQPGPSKSLRNWFSAAMMTPRFTPLLTAGLVLMAIGISLVLLKYVSLERHENQNAVGLEKAGRETEPTLRSPARSGEARHSGSAAPQAQQSASAGSSVQEERSGGGVLSRSSKTRTAAATHVRRGATVKQLVGQAEQKYLAAVKLLSRDIRKHGPKLDPEARAQFEETLAAIDRTIADTRQAVRQHPTDPEAVRYMLTAYAKKVEVLQEMASY